MEPPLYQIRKQIWKNHSIHVLRARIGAHLMGSGQDLNNSVFTINDVVCIFSMRMLIAQFTVLHNEQFHHEWVVVSYKRVKEKCVKGWKWCVAGCRRCSGAAGPAKHRRHHIKPPGALDKLDITQVRLSLCNYICPKPVALIFERKVYLENIDSGQTAVYDFE